MYSIRSRLLIALSVILGFVVVQAGITYYLLRQSEDLVVRAINHDFLAHTEVANVSIEGQKLRRFEKEYIIYVDNSDKRRKYFGEWRDSYNKIGEMLGAIAKNASAAWSAADLAEARKWQGALAGYGQGFQKLVANADAGTVRGSDAANETVQEAKEHFRVLLDGTAKVAQEKLAHSQDASREIRNNFRVVVILVVGSALAIVGLVAVLFIYLPRSIGGPIEQLARAAHRMSSGELLQPVTVGGATEFKDLADSLERMRISQKTLIDRMKGAASQR